MDKKIVHYSKDKIYIDNEITKEYIKLKKQQEKIENKLKPIEKQLKDELINTMEKLGKKDFSYNGINGKLKSGYNKTSFDSSKFDVNLGKVLEKLKEDDLKLYSQYLKTSYVNSSISITVD